MNATDNGNHAGLRRIAVYAAIAVAFAGIIFTFGFFIGRSSAGTQVTVYLQNPEGVYVPAQTAAPFSEVRLIEPDEEKTAAADSVRSIPAESEASTVAVITARTTAAAVTTSALRTTAAKTTASPAASTSGTTTETTAAAETTAKATTAAATPGVVNINTATQAQLETLPGIGPVKAAAIIAYRQEHGAFSSVDDLVKVSGIGKKTLSDVKPYVTVG